MILGGLGVAISVFLNLYDSSNGNILNSVAEVQDDVFSTSSNASQKQQSQQGTLIGEAGINDNREHRLDSRDESSGDDKCSESEEEEPQILSSEFGNFNFRDPFAHVKMT